MKKRTVITTEKREVWVISNGNITLESTTEDTAAVIESLTSTVQDDSEKLLTEESQERDE